MEVLFVLGGLESRKSTKIDFCNFLSLFQTGRFNFFFLFQGFVVGRNIVPGRQPRRQGTSSRSNRPSTGFTTHTISTGTSVVVKYIYKATSIGAFWSPSNWLFGQLFFPNDVATKYITYYIGITYKCSSQNGLLLRREGNRRKIRD